MTDATGRTMSATEVVEWRAMNADNEGASDHDTTPSEYDCERRVPKNVARKFGKIWPSS